MPDNETKHENLSIWESVQATDPEFTKNYKGAGGFQGTSINATWLARQATKTFGPMGIGWGVDILEETYREGAPLDLEPAPETPIMSVLHILRIKLWYILRGTRGEIVHFGQTPFVYKNKWGAQTDDEAPKKSMTDATTKALSMLGFSSDIFMGMYDDAEYRAQVSEESLMGNADDKDAELARQQAEYRDWKAKHLALVETAQSKGELRTLVTMMDRKMQRHGDAGGQKELHRLKEASIARITPPTEEVAS